MTCLHYMVLGVYCNCIYGLADMVQRLVKMKEGDVLMTRIR
jgi:hypothetical protein